MALKHELGREYPAVGLQGWDRQRCRVAGLLISVRQTLGRRWQFDPSTIGFSSPRVFAGMLQEREGRIWGEMQGCPAN